MGCCCMEVMRCDGAVGAAGSAGRGTGLALGPGTGKRLRRFKVYRLCDAHTKQLRNNAATTHPSHPAAATTRHTQVQKEFSSERPLTPAVVVDKFNLGWTIKYILR